VDLRVLRSIQAWIVIVPLSRFQRLRIWHWRLAGRSIGFANGCFDLFHPGHLSIIAATRSCCARIVVAVDTDESIRRQKGPSRPVQPFVVRAAVLKLFADLVIPFDDDDELLELIRFVRPIVLIKGDDWRGRIVVGAHLARQVLFVPLVDGWSTSQLITDLGKS
jgi:D-beta-D-heptose 7-phosphate kinase/D-beta-D-heptose 1-phosphate adenosyltransferase